MGGGGAGHPFVSPNDPLKIRAPAGVGVGVMQQQMSVGGDVMHSQSNSEATYYNQPAALQHSHHINSTLPRSSRMQVGWIFGYSSNKTRAQQSKAQSAQNTRNSKRDQILEKNLKCLTVPKNIRG